jgi:hypothetical protein
MDRQQVVDLNAARASISNQHCREIPAALEHGDIITMADWKKHKKVIQGFLLNSDTLLTIFDISTLSAEEKAEIARRVYAANNVASANYRISSAGFWQQG